MPRAPRPTEVAEQLTQLREAAGLSTTQAGAAIGVRQGTIVHIEHGRLVPGPERMDALLTAYRADDDTRNRLAALAQAKATRRRTLLHQPNAPRYQAEYAALEQRATQLRSFTVTFVPGIAQTEAYTQAVVGDALTDSARDRWLEQRRKRRALLNDPGRDVELVIHAAALAVNRGGAEVMAEQVAWLAEVSRYSHVRVGIIAVATDIGTAAISNNIDFYALDDGARRVIIGTSEGTAILEDADAIDHHIALLDRLAGLAVWGDEARAALEKVAAWYRE